MKSEITKAAGLITSHVKNSTNFWTYERFKRGLEILQVYLELRRENIKNQLSGNTGQTDISQLDIQDIGIRMAGKDNLDLEKIDSFLFRLHKEREEFEII